ncbi:MAG TPA: hypothetical protein VFC35_05865 [Gemmatimonadaceae bacterium]|nr:hypothetical protein [Gemmatimonadaceae bacterium]
MMADLAGRPRSFANSSNAFVAVADRARRTSDRVLVTVEIAGFGCAIAVIAWAPHTVELTLLTSAIGALGLWGVTDHMLESHRRLVAPLRWMLEGFRFLIAAGGIASAIASGYALVGRLMGVFIL